MNITYEQFRSGYRKDFIRRVLATLPGRRGYDFDNGKYYRAWTVDWMRLAFELRIRTADKQGFFAGGEWCLPWNWAAIYFRVRTGA